MNRAILVLVLMILGHLIADYPLQGWLAQAKAKSYWQDSPKKNKRDYVAALICHSTMWAIIIFIPIMYYSWHELDWWWLLLLYNSLLHALIDDSKANMKAINLWQDQLLHLYQIVTTWLAWLIFIGVN